MAGYLLFHYNITDRSRIDELTQLSHPIDEKYGAQVIVGSPVKALEGAMLTHLIILKFETFEQALAYYHSEENKELSKLRTAITEGWVTVVPGDFRNPKSCRRGLLFLNSLKKAKLCSYLCLPCCCLPQ